MFSRAKPYYPNIITSDPQGHEFRGLFAYQLPIFAFSLPAGFIGVKEKFFLSSFYHKSNPAERFGSRFPLPLYAAHQIEQE